MSDAGKAEGEVSTRPGMADCREGGDYLLCALRIPAGWLAEYNQFYDMPFDHPMAWSVVCKDTLLMLKHMRRDVLVDLGWTPAEDTEGGYLLRVFESDHCGRELHRFESRDRAMVIGEIERLLDAIGGFRFAPLGDGAS